MEKINEYIIEAIEILKFQLVNIPKINEVTIPIIIPIIPPQILNIEASIIN